MDPRVNSHGHRVEWHPESDCGAVDQVGFHTTPHDRKRLPNRAPRQEAPGTDQWFLDEHLLTSIHIDPKLIELPPIRRLRWRSVGPSVRDQSALLSQLRALSLGLEGSSWRKIRVDLLGASTMRIVSCRRGRMRHQVVFRSSHVLLHFLKLNLSDSRWSKTRSWRPKMPHSRHDLRMATQLISRLAGALTCHVFHQTSLSISKLWDLATKPTRLPKPGGAHETPGKTAESGSLVLHFGSESSHEPLRQHRLIGRSALDLLSDLVGTER